MSSIIYMITTTNEPVLTDGLIPLTTIARRITPCFTTANNTVLLPRPGYYKVTGTITFSAPTTGDVTISLRKNSTEVPGIAASTTIATASTEIRTLPISGVVRVLPTESTGTLSLVNSGIGITVSNVSLIIEYEH